MKLGETVTYCGLKCVFLCGSIPIQTVCAQCLWWESWLWHGCNHIFPWGVLEAITMLRGGGGNGGAIAGSRCETVFPLCSVAIVVPSWVGSSTKLLEQKPWVSDQAGSVQFKCVIFFLPALGSLLQRRGVLEQVEPMYRQMFSALSVQVPVSLLRHSLMCNSPLSLSANHCPQPVLLPPCCGTAGKEPMWTFSMYQGASCGRVATVRVLSCFWYAAWVSANNGHFQLMQAPHWDQAASASHSWVFSPVVVAPSLVLC